MMKTMIFLAGLAVAAATPAAGKEPPVIETVSYHDLDLSSASDQTRLQRRIASVASRMCAEVTGATPAPAPVDWACYRQTVAAAQADVQRAIAAAGARYAEASPPR
jgi:UrcA family protein